MKWARSSLVLLLFGGLLAKAAPADISNGTFNAGITDWSIKDPFFPADDTTTAIAGGVAELGEPFPSGALSQTFVLSNAPLMLSFDFDFGAVADGTSGFSNDTMDIALFRPDPFNPLLPDLGEAPLFGGGFFDTFLNFDRNFLFLVNEGTVTNNVSGLAKHFEIDISGLGLLAGDSLTFQALMLPGFGFGTGDGFQSTGLVDNVNITVIPAPDSAILGLLGLLAILACRRRRFGPLARHDM